MSVLSGCHHFNCDAWTSTDFAAILNLTCFLSYYIFVVAVTYSHNPAFIMHYLLVLKGDIFRALSLFILTLVVILFLLSCTASLSVLLPCISTSVKYTKTELITVPLCFP